MVEAFTGPIWTTTKKNRENEETSGPNLWRTWSMMVRPLHPIKWKHLYICLLALKFQLPIHPPHLFSLPIFLSLSALDGVVILPEPVPGGDELLQPHCAREPAAQVGVGPAATLLPVVAAQLPRRHLNLPRLRLPLVLLHLLPQTQRLSPQRST